MVGHTPTRQKSAVDRGLLPRLCGRRGLPAGPLLGLVALIFVSSVLVTVVHEDDDRRSPETTGRAQGVVSSGEDWTVLARSLGDGPARTYAAEWEVLFARELGKVIAGAGLTAQLQAAPHVFYPFSGTDVATLLALQPTAKGYVLASQNPTFPVGPGGRWLGRDSWLHNETFVQAAKTAAREVIRLSHMGGYQYGFLVRSFSERYGAVTLLLAILGSLSTVEVDAVYSRLGLDFDPFSEFRSARH